MGELTTKLRRQAIFLVPFLYISLFLIIPLINVLFLALDSNFLDFSRLSLVSMFYVLNHPLNRYFLGWTIQQAILSTLFCIIIGLPASYLFAYYKFPGKSILRNILTVPFILPPIVVLMGFIIVFGHGGWVNLVWKQLTGQLLIEIYNTYEGILLAHVFYNIPVILRLTELGWKNVDQELENVAKSMGASRWKIFKEVQFPYLFPTLAAASLLVFIYTFNSFAIVLVLGGVKYQTLEVRIYGLAKTFFNYNAAAALTLVQLFINGIIITLYLYFSVKFEIPTNQTSERIEYAIFDPLNKKKSILRSLLIVGFFSFLSLISLLPLIGIFYRSFTDETGNFTTKYYERLFSQATSSYIGLPSIQMLQNSLYFAIAVMLLATFLALLLNYGINYEVTRQGTPKVTALNAFTGMIVILPLATSSVTLAFSLFSLYSQTPLYKEVSFAIIIAHTLVALPFSNRVIAATRANIDSTLLSVSLSLGASRVRTFLKVELPLLLPGIIVSMLFSFAISLGEFGATNFLARGNFATIPVGIYRLIETRNIGAAAAFSAILITLTAMSFLIIERIGKIELKI